MKNRNSKNLTGKKRSKTLIHPNGITQAVRNFYYTSPQASAKTCLIHLGYTGKRRKHAYDQWRGLCYKIKSQVNKKIRGKIIGKPRSKPDHKEFYTLDVDGLTFVLLCNEADRNKKGKDRFYRSKNWNRQINYVDSKGRFTIWLYPRSQTCRVLKGRKINDEDFRNRIESAFLTIPGIHWTTCEKIANSVLPSDRSRVFPVPVYHEESWVIENYLKSLGIRIKGDFSHRRSIEVDETYPRWTKDFIASLVALTVAEERRAEAELVYAENQKTHTKVMEKNAKIMDKNAEIMDKNAEIMEEIAKMIKKEEVKKPLFLNRKSEYVV